MCSITTEKAPTLIVMRASSMWAEVGESCRLIQIWLSTCESFHSKHQSLDWNQRQFGCKQNISLILMLYDQFRNDRKTKSHSPQQDVWTWVKHWTNTALLRLFLTCSRWSFCCLQLVSWTNKTSCSKFRHKNSQLTQSSGASQDEVGALQLNFYKDHWKTRVTFQ